MTTKNVKLTLKTAKEIVRRELGISPEKLKLTSDSPDVYIYEMETGRFRVKVENDWFERTGLISLLIDSRMGDSVRIFYDPITLEENYDAGDRYRKEMAAERMGLTL